MSETLDKTQTDQIVDSLSADEAEMVLQELEKLEAIGDDSPIAVYDPTKAQEPFHSSEAGIKFLFGGNMSGKTYALCKETCCELLEEDPSYSTPDRSYLKHPLHEDKPKKVWFASVSILKAKSIFEQDLRRMLPKGSYRRFDNSTYTLYMNNGNTLQLMSYESDIRMWQSDAVDFIGLDEQPPFLHFKESRSRVNRKSGRIACSMTPLYANSAWTFREIVQREKDNPNVQYWIMDLTDNIYLTKEQIDSQIAAFKGTDEEEARIHGRFMILQGVIHPQFNEAIQVMPQFDITEDMLEEFDFCRAIDLHKRNPNVCQWFMYKREPGDIKSLPKHIYLPDKGPIVIQFDEIAIDAQHMGMFAEQVRDRYPKIDFNFNIIDSADSMLDEKQGRSLRAELRYHGIAGMNANRSHGAGKDRLNEYIRANRMFITDQCRESIASVQYHIWDNYKGARKDEIDPKETWVRKDDHQVRNWHYTILMMPSLNTQRAESIYHSTGYVEPGMEHYFGKGQGRNYQKMRYS